MSNVDNPIEFKNNSERELSPEQVKAIAEILEPNQIAYLLRKMSPDEPMGARLMEIFEKVKQEQVPKTSEVQPVAKPVTEIDPTSSPAIETLSQVAVLPSAREAGSEIFGYLIDRQDPTGGRNLSEKFKNQYGAFSDPNRESTVFALARAFTASEFYVLKNVFRDNPKFKIVYQIVSEASVTNLGINTDATPKPSRSDQVPLNPQELYDLQRSEENKYSAVNLQIENLKQSFPGLSIKFPVLKDNKPQYTQEYEGKLVKVVSVVSTFLQRQKNNAGFLREVNSSKLSILLVQEGTSRLGNPGDIMDAGKLYLNIDEELNDAKFAMLLKAMQRARNESEVAEYRSQNGGSGYVPGIKRFDGFGF